MPKKTALLIVAFLFLAPSLAQAAQMPRFLGSEKKFRSYIYNPNDVYRYVGHYTYQGFIEFEDKETVSTISMGNPSLWLFEHLGNRLFLKPVGEDNSETNMTVITNKRVYHFELMAKEAKGITDKDLIFVVKFVYPDEQDKNILEFPKTTPTDEPDLRDLSPYNFNYQYTGEPSIAPIRVFDNGEFTYFQFSKKNAEVPAIFAVDSEGFESLINFRAAGSYIVVEKVGAQFTLRNGNEIVCVYNTNLYTSGRAKQSTVKSIDASGVQTKNSFPAITSEPTMLNPATSNPGGIAAGMPRLPGQMY
jgi:type IV secretion system protein VirB9